MAELRLAVLDGQEPLGFAASVGLLAFLCDALPGERVRLCFAPDGEATVAFDGSMTIEMLAAVIADHLVVTAAASGSLAPGMEPYGAPFPCGQEADGATPAEVRRRLESIGIDPARRNEREWLRSITSDVASARGARPKSPASMTLRNTRLSWRARDLARIMADELADSPSAVVRALTVNPLVQCRERQEAALASSGWDRGATGVAVRLAVAPPVAVLHEWLAIYASPFWPLESDGRRVIAACWYTLDAVGDVWFVWPLWKPFLGRAAVRHLLSTELCLQGRAGGPALREWPHRDIHAMWAARRTVVSRGDAKQNDPYLAEPVRLRVAQ